MIPLQPKSKNSKPPRRHSSLRIFCPCERFCQLLAAVAILFTTLTNVGCDSSSDSASDPSKPKQASNYVVAVSYPLQFLTQRIVGPTVKVDFPVPSEGDSRTWRPGREAIQKFQTADLIVANGTGASYADWLATVTLPDSRICNTASRGLSLRDYIQVDDVNIVHSHGPEGEHSHPMMVSLTWLDPAIAKKQAKYIAKELKRVYPSLQSEIDENLKALSEDLKPLIERMETLKSKFLNEDGASTVTLLSANPDLKFLTRAAGLEDLHFNWKSDSIGELDASDLKTEIAKKTVGKQAKPLILVPAFLLSSSLNSVLENVSLRAVKLETIESQPEQGDYLSAVSQNIETIEKLEF